VFEGRWFQNSGIHATYYFLCFIAPVIFAFAAGAVSYRPPLAHAAAFMGLVAAPWIYENAMTDWGLGNTWLALNVPDNELGWYSPYYAQMTVLFVGLIAAAVVTAGLRLLPPPWQFRRSPIRERPGLRLLQVPSCLLSGLASQSCLIKSRVRLTIPLGRRCRFSPSKSADFNSTNPVSAWEEAA
jgi:hypothetical protein